MSMRSQTAQTFHRLHHEGLLVLANAWDAGSARLMQSLGAKALATTSAGVAWSHGYADGDRLPVALLAATVGEIARIATVPVSVDAEGGYAQDPESVGEAVGRLIDAGAVGINIEDGGGAPDLLCAKIERAKQAGAQRRIDLFVNARTDVYLHALVPPEQRLAEAVRRAERYRNAGADGIFVPALVDRSEIAAVASAIALPLNLLAWPGLPPAAELASLGVRRLSAGSGIVQALFGHAAALASAFLQLKGGLPATEVMPYAEINALMAGETTR